MQSFLGRFGVDKQITCVENPERVVTSQVGGLATWAKKFSRSVVEQWLQVHLENYQDFVGIKNDSKMNINQLAELSQIIYSRYFYLKPPEIMLFFGWLKQGKYGKIYGTINPVEILQALHEFRKDEAEIEQKVESKQNEAKRAEERKRAVSREQYEAMLKRKTNQTYETDNQPNV